MEGYIARKKKNYQQLQKKMFEDYIIQVANDHPSDADMIKAYHPEVFEKPKETQTDKEDDIKIN